MILKRSRLLLKYRKKRLVLSLDFDVVSFARVFGSGIDDGAERLGNFALTTYHLAHIAFAKKNRNVHGVAFFDNVIIDVSRILGKMIDDILN